MKKVTIILVLFLSCIVMPSSAKDIFKIGLQTVTDDKDQTSVYDYELTGGSATYYKSLNMLVLFNTSITNNHITVYEDLTISIYGTASIVSGESGCIEVANGKSITIRNYSSDITCAMSMKSNGGALIALGDKSKCTVSGLTVSGEGTYGVKGNAIYNSAKLSLRDNGELKVKGTAGSVIGLGLLDANISTTGAFFSYDTHDIRNQSTLDVYINTVTLVPPTTYGVEFFGEEISSANYKRLSYDEHVTAGQVTYDIYNRVLTLDGVTMTMRNKTPAKFIINNTRNDEVTICLKGTNEIYADNNTEATFYSPGKSSAITVRGQENGTAGSRPSLTINGGSYGFYGFGKLNICKKGYWNADLSFKTIYNDCVYGWDEVSLYAANVSFESSYGMPIKGVRTLNFKGCGVVGPTNAYYDLDTKDCRIYSPSGESQTTRSLEVQRVTTYGLFIGKSWLHSGNRSNYTIGVKSGKVARPNSVVELRNAVIDGPIVFSPDEDDSSQSLSLWLYGDNNKIQANYPIGGITSTGSLSITGAEGTSKMAKGTLTIENIYQDVNNGSAIAIMPDTNDGQVWLSISNTNVFCDYGSAIDGTVNSNITIRNSNVSTYDGISGFKSMTLEDCYINTPDNGYYNNSFRAVYDRYGNEAQRVYVKAAEVYPLAINGIRLNQDNYLNSSAIGVDPRVFEYDPETNVLTLDECNLNGTYGLETFDDITINCAFNSRLSCNDDALIVHKGTTTLTGNGKLVFDSSCKGCSIEKNAKLEMRNANVIFSGGDYDSAISGDNSNWAEVTINHSTVTFQASGNEPTMKNIKTLNLRSCEINNDGVESTKRLWFNEDAGGVVAGNGGLTNGPIYIRPTSLWGDINGDGEVNTTDVTALYNVIFGTDTTTDRSICDLDYNSEINTSDVTLLYNIIFGTAK